MNATDVPSLSDALSRLAGSFLGLVILTFLALLVITSILLPLVVFSMHGLLNKLIKLNRQMDEKLHQLAWYAKQRHERRE